MIEKTKEFLYNNDFLSVSLRLDGEPSANTILGGIISVCAIDQKLLNLLHDEVKVNVVEDMRKKEMQ